MPLDPSIYNLARAPDTSNLQQALQHYEQKPMRQAQLGRQQEALVGEVAQKMMPQIDTLLRSGDAQGAMEALNAGRTQLQQAGIEAPPSPIMRALEQGDTQTALKLSGAFMQRLNSSKGGGIGTYNPRDYTTESFAKFQETGDPSVLRRYESQRVIDVGGVPHAMDPSTGEFKPVRVTGEDGSETTVTTDTVAESEAAIKDRITRAEQNAKSATGQIQEFYTQLGNIEKNIGNYEEAKRIIQEEGAMTGPAAAKLPNIRSAAVKLENLQAQLGLDIIGNTTFGALSESELEFALRAALPDNLDGPELVDWLDRKIAAQQKVADYLSNAIQFLNEPGNSLADLQALNPRGGQQGGQGTRQQQQSTQQPNTFTSQSGITFTVE